MNTLDGFVFDLDGTVYLGEQVLPGAVECLAELRRQCKRVVFISNKPLEPRQNYAAKLTRLGIPTREEEIINSSFVLGRYLSTNYPELNYYVVGEEQLHAELRGYGLSITGELNEQDAQAVIQPEAIQAVIVAFDRTLDYRKLNTAYQALVRGARYFATNDDKTCPMPGGAIPDAGATLAALEHLTGRRPELVAGKPSAQMLQVALDLLQLPPERCLLVGDRLETDIRMGQQAGFHTAVVLTGVTRRADLIGLSKQPDLVLENLEKLCDYLKKEKL